MALLDETGDTPRLPHGAYSQIARRLRPQVTPEAVRLVYLGKSTSARISAAIETYRRRLPAQHPAHLASRSAHVPADVTEAHTAKVA